MSAPRPSRWRPLLLIPPLLVGAALLFYATSERQPPLRVQSAEAASKVRVVTARSVAFVPRVQGYGVVRPGRTWPAVAQVSGRIVELHPRLHDGEVLSEGTDLFRIDPVDYELRAAEFAAQLAELDVTESNARASLAIEERTLAVAVRELARLAQLARQGTSAESAVDSAERSMLASRAAVQSARNALALVPAERRLLQVRHAQAQRDLANTRVAAPFTLRIAELAIERDQYVAVGQSLFQGDAVDRVEVTAQVPMASLRRLFRGRTLPAGGAMAALRDISTVAGLTATVRLDLGDAVAVWEATFERFSDGIDPATRTVGTVVSVDDPFGKAVPGERPPLGKGMFVQVELAGHPQPGVIVVPRSAIRRGQIHVVGEDSRLQVRTVTVAFTQGDTAVVAAGVAAGEQVLVSRLIPAVAGMRLDPELDAAAQKVLDAPGALP